MSGICGVVNLDGAPVDRHLLENMMASIIFRGPDAQEIWIGRAEGLGHTLLRATFESEHECQPFSLEGDVWITADARIDGQNELKKKIAACGGSVIGSVPDAELILHAYRAWGEDCVKHLIGDFAFAIWDGRRKKIFCARDHFGVKPFFYAQKGHSLIFSNTLDCVRNHPAVANRLNDMAIADFLLFESNQDPSGTAFADICRLPPSQSLTCSADGLVLRRYWTFPSCGITYRSAGEYVEHFRGLMDIAIADRLRSTKIGVEMSGGLDSTAIAAIAKHLLSRQSEPFELHASTTVYDRLLPDEERKFAEMTARMLDIPIHYCVVDNFRLYQHFEQQRWRFPEPSHEPDGAASIAALNAQAARSRVLLTGWDGDAVLNESPKPYFQQLLNERRIGKLTAGLVRYAISERRVLPRRLSGLFTDRPTRPPSSGASYPTWLNPVLERRLGLRARWEHVTSKLAERHPLRPNAFGTFAKLTEWSNFFDCYDAGVTGVPLECRHPFIDLRLIEYCLALPPVPWCIRKTILREAMRGMLPDAVRLRPKTPASSRPAGKMLRAVDAQWIDDFIPARGLGDYVDHSKIPNVWGGDNDSQDWMNLRPLSLNLWFQSLRSTPQREGTNDESTRQTDPRTCQESLS
jgi:asparagine synthase (glutamine-hydrolysing)